MCRFLIYILSLVLPFVIWFGFVEVDNRLSDLSILNKKKDHWDSFNEVPVLCVGPSHLANSVVSSKYPDLICNLSLSNSAPNVDSLILDYCIGHKEIKVLLVSLSLAYLGKRNGEDWIEHHRLNYYFSNWYNTKSKIFLTRLPMERNNGNISPSKLFRTDEFGDKLYYRKHHEIFEDHNLRAQDIVKSDEFISKLAKHNLIRKQGELLNVKLYRKIIHEFTERGIPVVFVSTPKTKFYNESISQHHIVVRNTFVESFKENSLVHFWNFEELYENELTLFYDPHHLNNTGAKKFTEFLMDSLIQSFPKYF